MAWPACTTGDDAGDAAEDAAAVRGSGGVPDAGVSLARDGTVAGGVGPLSGWSGDPRDGGEPAAILGGVVRLGCGAEPSICGVVVGSGAGAGVLRGVLTAGGWLGGATVSGATLTVCVTGGAAGVLGGAACVVGGGGAAL